MSLGRLVLWGANNVGYRRDIRQVIVIVPVAQCAVVWPDFHGEGAHKLILDDKMMPRLVFNLNHVLEGVWFLHHGYPFEGLNCIWAHSGRFVGHTTDNIRKRSLTLHIPVADAVNLAC
jgi:hypothetical protein